MRRSVLDSLLRLTASADDAAAPLRLRRAWIRTPEHLLLEYAGPSGSIVPAQWMRDAGALQHIQGRIRRGSPGIRGVALLPAAEGAVLLHPGGADDRLPGLAPLLARPGAELVGHRPGRRAVVRVPGPGAVRYAKAIRPGRLDGVRRAHEWVMGLPDRRFRAAPIDECDGPAGVLITGELAGVHMHDLAGTDGDRYIAAARAAGAALRSLHRQAPAWAPVHDADAETRMLEEKLRHLASVHPSSAGPIAAALPSVRRALGETPQPACAVHRDLYDKQIVATDDGPVGLLDFDTLARGEPAIDLGNMLAHMELRVLQGELDERVMRSAAGEFLAAYGARPADRGRIRCYADATRLRLAMLYALWPRWSGVSPRVLGRIGAPIGPGEAAPVPAAAPQPEGSAAARAHHLVRPAESRPASPLFFLVGCPRSGTTMLERMLDAHPAIAMVHETRWVTRHARHGQGPEHGQVLTRALADELLRDHRFARMGVGPKDMDQLLADGPIPYRGFVSAVYDLFRGRAGKELAGDKSTGGYVRDLPRVRAVCPRSRIVHLVRDGRSVCLSVLDWPKAHRAAGRFPLWNMDPVATTAAWWRWHVLLGARDGRPMGRRVYREIRYEDLVACPAQTCAEVCGFLGVEYDEAMVRFAEGRTDPTPGLSPNRAWLPPTPGLRDWRTQMRERDIELFEAVAGDALDLFGYERRFPRVSASAGALAERFLRQWDEQSGETTEIHPVIRTTTITSATTA